MYVVSLRLSFVQFIVSLYLVSNYYNLLFSICVGAGNILPMSNMSGYTRNFLIFLRESSLLWWMQNFRGPRMCFTLTASQPKQYSSPLQHDLISILTSCSNLRLRLPRGLFKFSDQSSA